MNQNGVPILIILTILDAFVDRKLETMSIPKVDNKQDRREQQRVGNEIVLVERNNSLRGDRKLTIEEIVLMD